MAFLRFSRDRRGYENTYLLHAARPRGDKDRPRLLYWFRTPPHLKVGRTAFDDEVIRQLEDEYPDLEFDWTQLLESAASGAADRNGAPRDVPEPSSSSDSPTGGDDASARPSRRHRRRGRPPAG